MSSGSGGRFWELYKIAFQEVLRAEGRHPRAQTTPDSLASEARVLAMASAKTFDDALGPSRPVPSHAHAHTGDERCAECCDHLCVSCGRYAASPNFAHCGRCTCHEPGCMQVRMCLDSDFCAFHQG